MPITPTYPGVYVQEIPSGVRPITGVATSITAFVGRALKGPVDTADAWSTASPTSSGSSADSGRDSTMSFAVRDFFLNGGGQALIVRLTSNDATASTIDVGDLHLAAASPGAWSAT